jgi:hypothetical protein
MMYLAILFYFFSCGCLSTTLSDVGIQVQHILLDSRSTTECLLLILLDLSIYSLMLAFISGLRHNVNELCALLRYYTALCGNCFLMFQDNVSVASSRVKSLRKKKKMGPIHCPETLVNVYHMMPHNIPEQNRSHSLMLIYF